MTETNRKQHLTDEERKTAEQFSSEEQSSAVTEEGRRWYKSPWLVTPSLMLLTFAVGLHVSGSNNNNQNKEVTITDVTNGSQTTNGNADEALGIVYVTATPQPTQEVRVITATPQHTEVDTTSEDEAVRFANGVSLTGFPERVVPYRVADAGETHEQTCTIADTCNIIGEPGVITVDDIEQAGPSAIHISPDTQYILSTENSSVIIPEGGYIIASGAGMTIRIEDTTIELEARSRHGYYVVIRGKNTDNGPADLNVQARFSNYTSGAVLITRFNGDPNNQAFVSERYVQQNVDNALKNKNCGAQGCDTISLVTIDINDGATTVTEYDGTDWNTQATNLVFGQ